MSMPLSPVRLLRPRWRDYPPRIGTAAGHSDAGDAVIHAIVDARRGCPWRYRSALPLAPGTLEISAHNALYAQFIMSTRMEHQVYLNRYDYRGSVRAWGRTFRRCALTWLNTCAWRSRTGQRQSHHHRRAGLYRLGWRVSPVRR